MKIKSLLLSLCLTVPLSAGSLYQVDKSPFSTFIAQKVGDILTVVVSESASAIDDGNRELQKDNNIKTELKKLFFPELSLGRGLNITEASGGTPGLELDSTSNFKARAKNQANHQLTTRLQARIIEQVRDGEFVIRGARKININGKDKTVFVSGVIRQRDITPDNTIKSEQIADAMIEIEGEVAQQDLSPSVFTKLFNIIF